jgi:hypothetical protein
MKSLKKSVPQIYNYLQLIKGPHRKMRFISEYMDGVRMGRNDEGPLLTKILQVEKGRLIVDYESRVHIFGRSTELFGARKIENENCRR